MSTKPKLLNNLLDGEKRRHHVAAYVTHEGEWNQHEPNSGMARMFIVMLILHVFIIGGIILSDFAGEEKTPAAPAAKAVLAARNNDSAPSDTAAAVTPAVPSPAPAPASASITVTDQPAPAVAADHEKYEVRSGDSLPLIVARFGVDRDELIALNKLDGDAEFTIGTTLLIPKKKSAPLQVAEARPMPASNTVPPSQENIADAPAESTPPVTPLSGVSAGPLALTPISSEPPATSLGSAGIEKTSQPESAVAKADEPPAAPQKAVSIAPPPKPVPTPSEMSKRPVTKPSTPPATKSTTTRSGSHVLAKGETLYRLSAKYGVSVNSIIKANNIKDPSRLRDGMRLVIPAK